MAGHFLEVNQALSRLLVEQSRAVAVHDHPTAKGDGREDLLRQFLAERIGTTFGICKAEVVDSTGATSGELDAVIYDQSVASCLSVLGARRIVRVESVVATIEVKSKFEPSSWNEEYQRAAKGIGKLVRRIRPTPFHVAMSNFLPPEVREKDKQIFSNGLGAFDTHQDVPAIVSAYFGFDGPAVASVQSFIETPLLDAVCVVGKYTVAKRRVGFDKKINGTEAGRGFIWGQDDDALGAFLHVLEGALARALDARAFVLPAQEYYQPPTGVAQ